MALDHKQQLTVAEWARGGVPLATIQARIAAEFGATMTYMEVRFLVDDLKVDLPPPPPPPPEPAKEAPPAPAAAAPAKPKRGGLFGLGRAKEEPAAAAPAEAFPEEPVGGVAVEIDRVMKPGTLVSGSATFSDGQTAQWFLDERGRLGFQPAMPGYKPSAEDIQEFQFALQEQLQRLGYA